MSNGIIANRLGEGEGGGVQICHSFSDGSQGFVDS